MQKPIIKHSNMGDFVRLSIFPIGVSGAMFLDRGIKIIESPFFLLFLFGLQCFFSVTLLNFYNFYEEYVEIYYPLRIGKGRRKRIYYSDIDKIKYYGNSWGGATTCICEKSKKKKRFQFANFSCTSLKKNKKTLQFLQSKGIPIEIKSDDEKIQRILD